MLSSCFCKDIQNIEKTKKKMQESEKEPPAKRSKSTRSKPVTEIVTKAVLSDELTKEIDLTTVWVSRIAEKKQISSLMQELCRLLPMFTCQHLKRVRQNEIIICRGEDCVEDGLEEFLKQRGLSPEAVACLCENAYQTQVPASSPKLRWQYEQMHKLWPCKFHSDSYLESLYDGSNFNEHETQFQLKVTQLLLDLSTDIDSNGPVGICVDPRTCSIVAIAGNRATVNPIMHCPLVLIDFVACTQNAGAWNDRWHEEFLKDDAQEGRTLQGISKKYYDYIQQKYSRLNFEFGAESLREKCTIPGDVTELDNLAKYGPYLCTGYDVYLLVEPCLMCAMALVHSRTRRVFFVHRSHSNGALANEFKLHTVKDLNHHYEVFQCNVIT